MSISSYSEIYREYDDWCGVYVQLMDKPKESSVPPYVEEDSIDFNVTNHNYYEDSIDFNTSYHDYYEEHKSFFEEDNNVLYVSITEPEKINTNSEWEEQKNDVSIDNLNQHPNEILGGSQQSKQRGEEINAECFDAASVCECFSVIADHEYISLQTEDNPIKKPNAFKKFMSGFKVNKTLTTKSQEDNRYPKKVNLFGNFTAPFKVNKTQSNGLEKGKDHPKKVNPFEKITAPFKVNKTQSNRLDKGNNHPKNFNSFEKFTSLFKTKQTQAKELQETRTHPKKFHALNKITSAFRVDTTQSGISQKGKHHPKKFTSFKKVTSLFKTKKNHAKELVEEHNNQLGRENRKYPFSVNNGEVLQQDLLERISTYQPPASSSKVGRGEMCKEILESLFKWRKLITFEVTETREDMLRYTLSVRDNKGKDFPGLVVDIQQTPGQSREAFCGLIKTIEQNESMRAELIVRFMPPSPSERRLIHCVEYTGGTFNRANMRRIRSNFSSLFTTLFRRVSGWK